MAFSVKRDDDGSFGGRTDAAAWLDVDGSSDPRASMPATCGAGDNVMGRLQWLRGAASAGTRVDRACGADLRTCVTKGPVMPCRSNWRRFACRHSLSRVTSALRTHMGGAIRTRRDRDVIPPSTRRVRDRRTTGCSRLPSRPQGSGDPSHASDAERDETTGQATGETEARINSAMRRRPANQRGDATDVRACTPATRETMTARRRSEA